MGEEAHIVSGKINGPRSSEPIPGAEIDGFLNLMLMCPTHHRIIDEQPEIYTVNALTEIKKSHENNIRELYVSEKIAQRLEVSSLSGICDGNKIFGAWRVGETLLTICCFGSDPIRVSTNRWRGSGLLFRVNNSRFGSRQLGLYSEANPDVEFSVEGSLLRIIEWSYDADSGSFIPFLERQYDLNEPLLLPRILRLAECVDVSNFSESDIIDQFYKSVDSGDDIQRTIFHFRNPGLSNPDIIISALDTLRARGALDGATAEAATEVKQELLDYKNAIDTP